MSDAGGNLVLGSETRYLPFGDYRSGGPNEISDRGFTGQKENMEMGLYYYNARYYAPGLGRFLSADTIVPNPTNPQSLNRYSYVYNNPINFSDPSGHCIQLEMEGNGLCLREQSTTITNDYDASKPWIVPEEKTTYHIVHGGKHFNPVEQMIENYNGGLDLTDPSWQQERAVAKTYSMAIVVGMMMSGGLGMLQAADFQHSRTPRL